MPRRHHPRSRSGGGGLAALVLLLVVGVFAGLVFLAIDVLDLASAPDTPAPPPSVSAEIPGERTVSADEDVPVAVRAGTGERVPVKEALLAEASGPAAVEAPPDALRHVTGPGITAGPAAEGPLEREPTAVVLPPEPEEPAEPFRLVVVVDPGLIDVRSHLVRLAHVSPPLTADTCTAPSGAEWPCGRRARTAVRRLIRRRAVACRPLEDPDTKPPRPMVRSAILTGPERPPEPRAARLGTPPEDGERETVVADCTVGNTDIGAWLVENGWAEPAPGAPERLVTLHAAARAAGRGLYAPDPR